MASLTDKQRRQVKLDWENVVITFSQKVRHVELGGGVQGNITCYKIPKSAPYGKGFSSNAKGRWQYKTSIRSKASQDRWASHTVPFVMDGHVDMTASHLCHKPRCHNPRHLVYENLDDNKGRNGCPGPHGGCVHQPPCIMQGPNATTPGGSVTTTTTRNFSL
jgi:hypothetical protein